MKRPAALVAALIAIGCAGVTPIPEPAGGSVSPPPETVLAFYQRAEGFYQSLVHRRFDTLETFNDEALREHFVSRDAFFEYYADLAYALSRAHFEGNRPSSVELVDFLFEDLERARVQVRFVGGDDRPLRPDRTHLVRIDVWELADGQWRLRAPGAPGGS